MAYYAILDTNNIVVRVIHGVDEEEYDWEQHYSRYFKTTVKRTSYNTHGGVHKDGGIPFRKNYAGIGYSYSAARDAFIPPKPFPSWSLNSDTCLWESPISYPDDGKVYMWDEITQEWVEQ